MITVNTPTAAVQTLYPTEQLVVPSMLALNGHAAIDGGLVLSSLLQGPGSMYLGGPGAWTRGRWTWPAASRWCPAQR